jgi:hypothetical protein
MAPIDVPAGEIAGIWAKAGSDLKFLLDREGVQEITQSRLFYIGVLTVRHFASFVEDKTELRKTLKQSFDMDPDTGDIWVRVHISKVLVAWDAARARATKLADAEGDAEARGVPKDVSSSDYHSMRATFEARYWEVTDRELPGRSYLERKLDEVEKAEVRAELLSEVVSKDEDEPDTLKTTWSLGGELKVVKSSSKVALPGDTEALRRRLTLLGTAWMFVASHQTSRAYLKGITPQLFQEYTAYLLGEFVLGMLVRDGRGNSIDSPAWHLLIAYEQAVRSKAVQLMRKGATFCDSLKQAWEDPVTKERYFTTPLALDSVTRRAAPQQRAPQFNTQEPLAKKPRTKGKGKEGAKNAAKPGTKKHGKNNSEGCAKETPGGKPLCFKFNTARGCERDPCRFLHCCGKCFKHGVSMLACTCSH